jgi:isochorismate synthase
MGTSTSVSLSTLTETEYITLLINKAVESNYSLAVWRLPNDPIVRLVISKSAERLKDISGMEDLDSGFIFAPFDTSAEKLFLKADMVFSFTNGQMNTPVTPIEHASNGWLTEQIGENSLSTPKPYVRKTVKANTTSKDFFCGIVSKAVDAIEQGTFEKVVLSRTVCVDHASAFNISHTFQNLCSRYSNALISFVTLPEAGSWLGASPELLVSVQDKKIFKTTALAGTQAYSHGVNLKSVAWTQKDIEEQALVERYIISCFKKIRLREYEEHGPRTVVAGNLIHLKSDFTVDMQATNFPQLGSVMLQLLHPTSAVCGMPLDSSLEFIHKHEQYDRQFYSGYLGPVNFQNRTDIFVNLRCLQLLETKFILYAGAGITQDSIPEKEFDETELKLNTLLKVIEE